MFCTLKLVLLQIVNMDDAVMVSILPEVIKSWLAKQVQFSGVFGFMDRVPNKVELLQWIKSPQVLKFDNSIEEISYLDKGFVSMRLSNENDVKKLL